MLGYSAFLFNPMKTVKFYLTLFVVLVEVYRCKEFMIFVSSLSISPKNSICVKLYLTICIRLWSGCKNISHSGEIFMN